jgi:lysyl-tRNA synthetase class 1
VDLRKTGAVKLPWRIDWPMRWSIEKVDFEPAGKDHHSEGGSFDTAMLTSKEVYNHEPPVTFQYDFVRIKGGSGKISSSTGEVVSLEDVLKYYQPEVVRFLFAGTRPNSEFAISFDLDVLKIYEDYDKIERSYFNKPDNPKKLKKWEKEARIYELSQISGVPEQLPYQIQIRHLTALLQINSGNIDAVIEYLGDIPERDIERFRSRAVCAWNWVNDFAPDDFRFSLRKPEDGPVQMRDDMASAVGELGRLVEEKLGRVPEKEFGNLLYDLMHNHNLESSDFFTAVYWALIGKDKGPRLVNFLHTIGKERAAALLNLYN